MWLHYFFFYLNDLTKTYMTNGCDMTLERTSMCAQYLYEGKKEKSAKYNEYTS